MVRLGSVGSVVEGKVILNEDAFEDAFSELEDQLDAMARGVVVTFWSLVLEKTPQYWGREAASWNFTINQPRAVDRSDLMTPQDKDNARIRQRGDPEGIQIANEFARETINDYRLGQIAYMTNGADHGEGMYAVDVEEGRVRLRAVNRPGDAVRASVATIDARFSRGISAVTAKELMGRKL